MREAVLREHERLDDLMRSGRKIIQDNQHRHGGARGAQCLHE